MKYNRIKLAPTCIALLGALFLWSSSAQAMPKSEQQPRTFNVFVSEPVMPVVSAALRDLPPARLGTLKPRTSPPRVAHPSLGLGIEEELPAVNPIMTPEVTRTPGKRTPNPLQVFPGIPFTGSHPPDTVGDVGPNHYVQATNTLIAVYDKNGAEIVAPHQMGDLWASIGGDCALDGGDPVVLYDQAADRWFLSQLGLNQNNVCIAVSKTPDPGGQYNAYRFGVPQLPDYLKFGVWPDAYYMGSNENSYTAYAFDRAKILAGQMATFQRFTGETNLLLPADLDGATPPPAGSPGLFYTFKDNVEHGGQDRLEVFELKVDWVTPANSTFGLVDTIPIQPFTYTVCGAFNFNCIPQKGTNQRLDALSEWPMFRLQYRNFGAYQTLVGNFTTDDNNANHAAIRWFELRKMGAGAWTLKQEGTHSPDGDNRFIGSIAMDQVGNIALGYTTSSAATFPDVRFATRSADDLPGTLQPEVTMQASNGSQTGVERWGDYSAMTVDPGDDCTFYYTTEYMPTQGQEWATIVGKFRMPNCGGKDNGAACANAGDCKSGFCSDNVCCATDCGTDPQDCQACSVATGSSADGTCSAVGAGKTCRAAAGPCDAAETCDGASKTCPADAFLATTTVCRASAAECDAPEMCSGKDAACPADILSAAGTVCRAATNTCDVDETCDGMTNKCPTDVLTADGTKCGDGGTCRAGTCKPPLTTSDDSSCGCRIPGGETSDGRWTFLLVTGLAMAGALRRRARRTERM